MLLVFSPMLLADEEADHNALRKLRATYEDAVNHNDLAKLKPVLADGFTGVMISGDEVKSFEDLEAFWKRAWDLIGAGGSYHVKVITDETEFFGDIGISRGYAEEVYHTAAGKDYSVRPRWTAVTRRQNGEWKIFRVHAGLNPMDNVLIREMVRRAQIVFGVSGLLLGVALGFVLRSLWRKKGSPRPATV
jgi:ketosteroid isomerase-like protein